MVEQQIETKITSEDRQGITKEEFRIAVYRLQQIMSEIPDEDCDPRIRLRIQESLEDAELLLLKLYPPHLNKTDKDESN